MSGNEARDRNVSRRRREVDENGAETKQFGGVGYKRCELVLRIRRRLKSALFQVTFSVPVSTVLLVYVARKEAVYIRVSGTGRRTGAGTRRRRQVLGSSTLGRRQIPLDAIGRGGVAGARLHGNVKQLVLDAAVRNRKWKSAAATAGGRVDSRRGGNVQPIGQLAVGQRVGGSGDRGGDVGEVDFRF